MSKEKEAETVREAVGIFFDSKHLHEAVDELKSSGFDLAELGLLAGQFTVKQKLGEFHSEINESADSPDGPRAAFVADQSMGDTVHALIGSLFFVGTTVASGAIVGATGGALSLITHESDAEYLEEQIDEGHLLLFVHTGIAEREKKVLHILSKHGAFNAKVYEAPATQYETAVNS
jgi:hypothetical protein